MAKSHASKVKLAPSTVVAQRVMAHHEQGGMSQGELRRNYLSGGGQPLRGMAEQMHVGKVPEGICRKGEWFGTQVSEPTRDAQIRPIVGKPSLPPVSPDDVMTYGENGSLNTDGLKVGLYCTRDGRIVRTEAMGDRPLPLLSSCGGTVRMARKQDAPVVDDVDDRITAILTAKGWPNTPKNRGHVADYLAAKDAGITRF